MLSSDGIACFISANTSARIGVGPVEPDASSDLLNDPPVEPRIAGQRQCRPAHLHLAVGVGTVPSFSGQAEAGSTTSAYFAVSVRKMSCTTRCSSLGERLACMLDIGVRHRRVLTHDVQSP